MVRKLRVESDTKESVTNYFYIFVVVAFVLNWFACAEY